MCFGKRAASTSSQKTSSQTTNRDERIGISDGGLVLSAKDNSSIINEITISDLDAIDRAFHFAEEALGFAEDAGAAASSFARDTQAQFSDNATSDLKEIISEAVKYAAMVAGAFIVWRAVA